MVKEIIYGAIGTIVFTGFAYAMDQRIDERVQTAIFLELIDARREQNFGVTQHSVVAFPSEALDGWHGNNDCAVWAAVVR